MEPIEKIEKVCESVNVSFEEARQALEENNWNVEETLIQFENQGKKVNYTEESEEVVTEIIPVKETTERKSPKARSFIRKIFDYLRTNSLRIEKNGEEIITVKLILFLILLGFGAEVILPLMIVGLFFNFKYKMVGRNASQAVNEMMNGASKMAESIKTEFQNA